MENAVNNLLVSKKHIDNLKAERNSLIQIYEVKNKIKFTKKIEFQEKSNQVKVN